MVGRAEFVDVTDELEDVYVLVGGFGGEMGFQDFEAVCLLGEDPDVLVGFPVEWGEGGHFVEFFAQVLGDFVFQVDSVFEQNYVVNTKEVHIVVDCFVKRVLLL